MAIAIFPKRISNSIDNWSLTDSEGNQYQQVPGGDNPYTFSVADSDGSYIINWYFPSNKQPGRLYAALHRAWRSALLPDDGDQLLWNAIFPDRGFPIEASQVSILVPEPAQILQYTAYVLGIEAPGYFTAERSVTTIRGSSLPSPMRWTATPTSRCGYALRRVWWRAGRSHGK